MDYKEKAQNLAEIIAGLGFTTASESSARSALTEAHAAGKAEGLAEGEAKRKELEEKNEYLGGRDRSLLEQHQASMITLGDKDLLAVGGRLLSRAEEAEAKLAAMTKEWGEKFNALGREHGEKVAALTAENKRMREALASKIRKENAGSSPCVIEYEVERELKALSPESEKPAPSSPDRCACGGIILADTEDWEHPLCDACYVKAGEPKKDPAEKPAPVVPSMVFHKPGCLHSDGYCDCYVIDKPAPSNVHTARMGHCQSCGCMTKTVAGKCGKCGAEKPAPDGEGRKMRPKVICLCGSTRFFQQFMDENYRLTMEGNIVLSVGFFGHASAQAHGQTVGISPEQKVALDELHKRKIDLADEVFVVNPGGYIGESTRGEIIYAEAHGKPVRYLAALGGGAKMDDEGRKDE